ncbi:hypothetical protein KBD61_01680 [Patescibacteria group bacterium]|nr:hypothetical protein [Patescibacteria group bacterium]MBP9709720.1 hypothetical protein [Patescibacteria group bacterium]
MISLRSWVLRGVRQEMSFFWLSALIYVLFVLCVVFQPLSTLIVTILPDDTFYYFQIAKRIAQGAGSTFDGIAPTNGYHPLWMAVLVPLFRFLPQAQAIQASLLVAATLYLALAGLLFKALRVLIPHRLIHGIVFAAWFFNPLLMTESINGLETSLSIFCLVAFVVALSKWKTNASTNSLLLIGAIGGGMLLARTDFIIYYAILVGHQLYLRRQTFFKDGLRLGLGTGIMLLPWLAWNLATFGTIVQVSGAAYTLAQYQRVFVSSTVNVGRAWPFVFAKATFSTTIYGLQAFLEQALYGWLVFLAGGMCLMAALFKRESVQASEETSVTLTNEKEAAWMRILPSLFIAGLVYFCVEVCLRWSIRSWYFAHLQILVWVGIAYAYYRSSAEAYLKRVKVWWFLPVIALMICTWVWIGYKEVSVRYADQAEFIQAADWMNKELPTGSKIGVFNSGIQGFLSRHQVINLDGLVNNEVYPYLKKRDVLAYIQAREIGYVSDFYKVIFGKFGNAWGVSPYAFFTQGKPITTLKIFDPVGIYLYKISEQGQNAAATSTKP